MERRSFLQGIFASIPLLGHAQAAISDEVIRSKTLSSFWDYCDITEEKIHKYLMSSLEGKTAYEAIASDQTPFHLYSRWPFRDKHLRDRRFDIISRGLELFSEQIIENINNLGKAKNHPVAFHDLQVRFHHQDHESVIEAAFSLHKQSILKYTYEAIKQHAKQNRFIVYQAVNVDDSFAFSDHHTISCQTKTILFGSQIFMVPLLDSDEHNAINSINVMVEQCPEDKFRLMIVSPDKKAFGFFSHPEVRSYAIRA